MWKTAALRHSRRRVRGAMSLTCVHQTSSQPLSLSLCDNPRGVRHYSNTAFRKDDSMEKEPQPSTISPKVAIPSFAKDLQKVLIAAEGISTTMPWNNEQTEDFEGIDPRRSQIFIETKKLLDDLISHIQQGVIQPQGKHRKEVSIFYETLLRLFSLSHDPEGGDSVWSQCRFVLDLMEAHQQTLQVSHCQSAVTVAVRYGFIAEAASLFRQQVDPGYSSPYDISVVEPTGLYALAKDAQARQTAPVENVMQAVHQLCMLSPSDQDLYVRAAGTALGHAKEGLGLLNYLQTSLEAPRLGASLIVATMQACILSNEAATAWSLWEERQDERAAEWKWSGGNEQLPPICTDLALRASPAVVDKISPEQVLTLYESLVDGGRAVSVEALLGVMRVLEQHGAWTQAVEIWFRIIADAAKDRLKLVYGDELVSPNVVTEPLNTSTTEIAKELSHVVVPVMRACQENQQHALSLICMSLWQGCCDGPSSLLSSQSQSDPWLSQLNTSIQQSTNSDELLVTVMASLSGFELPNEACELYDLCVGSDGIEKWTQASDLREFASTQSAQYPRLQRERRLATLGNEMQRYLIVHAQADTVSKEDATLISSALATTMESLLAWRQYQASLYLFRFMMDEGDSTASLSDVSDIVNNPSTKLPLLDSVGAALVKAYDRLNDPEMALRTFDSVAHGTSRKDIGIEWPLASTNAIKILLGNGAIDEALDMFNDLASHSGNPALYTVVARGLLSHARWQDVADVYRLALASNALSEDLSLITLKAIEELKPPQITRVMRSIAEEAAAICGMEPLAWVERQYHGLKNTISFKNLRRMLWWDDPSTAFLDELELVLGQWQARKAMIASEEPARAPLLASARIILNTAKRFHDDTIPPEKTRIPHVPRSLSAWKDLVDDIVNEFDMAMWQSKSGPYLAADVILAYRNLGSNEDCLSFAFLCLENEIAVHADALYIAIKAARDMKDENAAKTLRMIVEGNENTFA